MLNRAAATPRSPGLTPRQGEVLALIAEGRTNAAIARRLAITEKAVVQHASRIYDCWAWRPATRTIGVCSPSSGT